MFARVRPAGFFLAAAVIASASSAQVGMDLDDYRSLTDNVVEVTNSHPIAQRGVTSDPFGTIVAVNPYASTYVVYTSLTAEPDQVVPTGLNPVSIALYQAGPGANDRKVLVLCTGTHALFVHDIQTGDVEAVIRLDSEPVDLVVDHDNDLAYASSAGTGLLKEAGVVAKIDLTTNQVTDRYQIDGGERPGPLYLDRGVDTDPSDNRVYVACMVTGNNTTILPSTDPDDLSTVLDLDNVAAGDLPDHDVFRIDPFQPITPTGRGHVDPVITNCGSVINNLGRNSKGDMIVLSLESFNADPMKPDEPSLRGDFVLNQMKIVSGVNNSSGLIAAGAGIDLDDHDWTGSAPYDPALSLNQPTCLDFIGGGGAFVASRFSDLMLLLNGNGKRIADFHLPLRSQCHAIEVFQPDSKYVLALCLGTMSIEVFHWPSGDMPIQSLPIGLDPTPDQIRRGRDIFLDGQLSEDARSTCASCHPGARSDQLGWQLSGVPCDVKDVMVTQSLMSIADTAPHHWRGERELADFGKAFRGLLGTPEALDPDLAQLADLYAFIRSCQAPANPTESPRRKLDENRVAGPAPNGFTGNPAAGQVLFDTVPNFNGNTCAECHSLETGGNGNLFAEIGSFAPRAAVLEVAHFRQLQNKGRATILFDRDGDGNDDEMNVNGFGTAHNGNVPNLFRFVEGFPAFDGQEHADIAAFIDQFDQGLSPAAHWVELFDQGSFAAVVTEIDEILIQGADNDWNDVAIWGTYFGQPSRRYLDRGSLLFLSEDPTDAPISWATLQTDTQNGDASHVVVGLPLGNGRRFGIDFDNDGLANRTEINLMIDPWDPDSDDDGWWDGHEQDNNGDPDDPAVGSNDNTPPFVVASQELMTSVRVAKYRLEASEDCTYVVETSVDGGLTWQTSFERGYFSREDTFVVDHTNPSTPTKPALEHLMRVTLMDRGMNSAGPFLLNSFFPLEVIHQSGLPVFMHVDSVVEDASSVHDHGTGELRAVIDIKVLSNFNAPDFTPIADDQMVFSIVSIYDPATDTFTQSNNFTTIGLSTSFRLTQPEGGDEVYAVTPGPHIVSPMTLPDGTTRINFTQGGLSPGDVVKVSVMGILNDVDVANDIYSFISVGQMQPLAPLLEDSAELRITF